MSQKSVTVRKSALRRVVGGLEILEISVTVQKKRYGWGRGSGDLAKKRYAETFVAKIQQKKKALRLTKG